MSPRGRWIPGYSQPQTRHTAALEVRNRTKVVILVILVILDVASLGITESGLLRHNPLQVRIWASSTRFYPIFYIIPPFSRFPTREDSSRKRDNSGRRSPREASYPGCREPLEPRLLFLLRRRQP